MLKISVDIYVHEENKYVIRTQNERCDKYIKSNLYPIPRCQFWGLAIIIWKLYLNTKDTLEHNRVRRNQTQSTEGPSRKEANFTWLLSRVSQKPLNSRMNISWCSHKSPYVLLCVKEAHLLELGKLGSIQLLWWLCENIQMKEREEDKF